jgi:hypothetical protein
MNKEVPDEAQRQTYAYAKLRKTYEQRGDSASDRQGRGLTPRWQTIRLRRKTQE